MIPMEFINQNILLVSLVAVSGLSLLWPMVMRPSGNSVGPAEATQRAPTVAVDLGRAAEPVSAALAAHGINCWAGDFYAVRPLSAMGIDPHRGVLRMSMVHYTSAGDVARLIAALDTVL